MATKVDAPAHAWADPRGRRALGRYVLHALGMLGLAVVVVAIGTLFMTSNGDAKHGVPSFTPVVCIGIAGVAAAFGIASLLNSVRIAWTLWRWPWSTAAARYEEVGAGTPNGQPVLWLQVGDEESTLTLAAAKWRWSRFRRDELLLASPPRRGGVVATTDFSAIAWAGRSPFTALLLWRRGKRLAGASPTDAIE